MWHGITKVKPGIHLGDIGWAIQQFAEKILSGPVECRLEYETWGKLSVRIEDDKAAEMQACDLVEPEQGAAFNQVAYRTRFGVVAQILPACVNSAGIERRDNRRVVRVHRS